MSQIKKWKVQILGTGNSTSTYVYIDAKSSDEAVRFAKAAHPNLQLSSTAFEVR